jgi:hypothetical protein
MTSLIRYLDATPVHWSARCAVHRVVMCGPTAEPTADVGNSNMGESAELGERADLGERAELGVHMDGSAGHLDSPASGTPPLLVACVLFRPGHYDVLQPHTWRELIEDQSILGKSNASFVPPIRPGDHEAVSSRRFRQGDHEAVSSRRPAFPLDTCHECEAYLKGCWLCGRWVCPTSPSLCTHFGLARPPEHSSASLTATQIRQLERRIGGTPHEPPLTADGRPIMGLECV